MIDRDLEPLRDVVDGNAAQLDQLAASTCLSPTAWGLMVVLFVLAQWTVQVSLDQLASVLGRDRRTLNRALDALLSKGLVERVKYTVPLPEPWVVRGRRYRRAQAVALTFLTPRGLELMQGRGDISRWIDLELRGLKGALQVLVRFAGGAVENVRRALRGKLPMLRKRCAAVPEDATPSVPDKRGLDGAAALAARPRALPVRPNLYFDRSRAHGIVENPRATSPPSATGPPNAGDVGLIREGAGRRPAREARAAADRALKGLEAIATLTPRVRRFVRGGLIHYYRHGGTHGFHDERERENRDGAGGARGARAAAGPGVGAGG